MSLYIANGRRLFLLVVVSCYQSEIIISEEFSWWANPCAPTIEITLHVIKIQCIWKNLQICFLIIQIHLYFGEGLGCLETTLTWVVCLTLEESMCISKSFISCLLHRFPFWVLALRVWDMAILELSGHCEPCEPYGRCVLSLAGKEWR